MKIKWDDDCDDYIPIEELIDYDDEDDENSKCQKIRIFILNFINND